MNILVVTQYFWPENFQINQLCYELKNRGHSVTVLTGLPNYPKGEIFSDFSINPHGFSNYGGIEVIRAKIFPRKSGSKPHLFFNYISFIISASIKGFFSLFLKKKEFDLIFVYEPSPITVCLPAIFLNFFYKKKIVFWVLDLWPDTLDSISFFRVKFIKYLMEALSKYIYSRCALVLAQSYSFIKAIEKYCDPKKIIYFPTWADDIFFTRCEDKSDFYLDKNKFNITFAGNIGFSQDLKLVLQSIKIAVKRIPNLSLNIFGEGRAKNDLLREINKLSLSNFVKVHDYLVLEEIARVYQQSDVLLASLAKNENFSKTIPAKIQSYLASGKPILTMMNGEGSNVISQAKAGLIAESGDFEKLSENILMLYSSRQEVRSQMGRHGCNYAKNFFNKDKLINELCERFIILDSGDVI